MEMSREEALTRLRAQESEIRRFGVKSLALFGSVARNEAQFNSDLDLVVDFDGEPSYDRYSRLKIFLEDLLNCQVDLVMAAAIKPRMRPYIERDAVRVA